MQVSDALNAQIGFTLFDAWLDAVEARHHHGRHHRRCGRGGVESPLIDAAFQAFNQYVKTKEIEFAALASTITSLSPELSCAAGAGIASAGTYSQTPTGVAT